MKDLIEALQIFFKYEDNCWPTSCEHDILFVYVHPEDVSNEDKIRLVELGFEPNDTDGFSSFRFGSA